MKQLGLFIVFLCTVWALVSCAQAQVEAQTETTPPAPALTLEELVKALEAEGYEVYRYKEGENLFNMATASVASEADCEEDDCVFIPFVTVPQPTAIPPTAIPPTPGSPAPTGCPTRPSSLPDASASWEEHISGVFVTVNYPGASMVGVDIMYWDGFGWQSLILVRSSEPQFWVPRTTAPTCLYPLAIGPNGIWDFIAFAPNGYFLNGGN